MEFKWPIPPGAPQAPLWTGSGFVVGGEKTPILQFETNPVAWDNELTLFHESHAEHDHFIDAASRRNALGELKAFVKIPQPVILEIGSSSGFLLPLIREKFPQGLVIGSDNFAEALVSRAKQDPSFPLLAFDVLKSPLASDCLDAIVLLDVLEHIKEDGQALAEVFRMLKPGGIAVIEVPAGPHLYGIYDEMLKHYRRYDLKTLRTQAERCGFKVLRASHLAFLLYPFFALVKKHDKKLMERGSRFKEDKVAQRIVFTRRNLFMDGIMRMEHWIGRKISYPFGIRCLLTLQKP